MQMGHFKGDKISQRRIDHFVKSATEPVTKIKDSRLENAYLEEIKNIRDMFGKQGGMFPPRYILYAQK